MLIGLRTAAFTAILGLAGGELLSGIAVAERTDTTN
jgi:hypothetical protein